MGQNVIRSLFVAMAFVIGMSAVGSAQGGQPPTTRAVRAVPEIDPASATAALAMLAGGILLIRGRRR